jgi:hypothetical protein
VSEYKAKYPSTIQPFDAALPVFWFEHWQALLRVGPGNEAGHRERRGRKRKKRRSGEMEETMRGTAGRLSQFMQRVGSRQSVVLMVFRRAQSRAVCGEAVRVFQRVPRGDIFRSGRSRSQLAEVGWSRSQIWISSFSPQLLINRVRVPESFLDSNLHSGYRVSSQSEFLGLERALVF